MYSQMYFVMEYLVVTYINLSMIIQEVLYSYIPCLIRHRCWLVVAWPLITFSSFFSLFVIVVVHRRRCSTSLLLVIWLIVMYLRI